MQRAYLEGMEQDESVPLTFERSTVNGMPEGFRLSERPAEAASLIDLDAMIGGLEAARRAGGR